jgi:hypothetical protein
MSTDTKFQSRHCSVKVTETVKQGNVFFLDTTNKWPYVLVTTGESIQGIGVFDAAGATGDTVPATLFNDIMIGYGTVSEGAAISCGASGAFEDLSSGGTPRGIALEAATTDTFKFIPLCQSADLKS